MKFVIPARGTLTPNNAVDPLRFYYRPIVGRLFKARIQIGLDLIDRRFSRLLEIGYGSGLLLPTLSAIADELYGVDLEAEPPGLRAALARLGVAPAALARADAQALPFPNAHFDGVVAFSILEHLPRPALARAAAEVARVLAPGGRFLVGCPAVHPMMNAAFTAIGFSGIEAHHVSSIRDVLEVCGEGFDVAARAALPRAMRYAPLGWALYSVVLLRRR
jgi:SAM-dependent methyltransferase